MKKVLLLVKKEFFFIFMLLIVTLIVVTSNEKTEVITYNINSARSVQAVHLVSKYNPKIEKVKHVKTFAEVLKYGPASPVKFTGLMTGYGPDCAGCSGFTGCSPRQNVKNGNVYFKVDYPEHNLDRARTQFKLVYDMETKMEEMIKIVNKLVNED